MDMLRATDRTYIAIDGPNLYATAKNLGVEIDYKRLFSFFFKKTNLVRINYYTAMTEGDEFRAIQPVVDYLSYNGYVTTTKPTKTFNGKIKGNMDIEIAVDALEIARRIDTYILFSGDGDFTSVVEALQRKGVRVGVVSTIRTEPKMIADELRRQVDWYSDLAEYRDIFLNLKRPHGGTR